MRSALPRLCRLFSQRPSRRLLFSGCAAEPAVVAAVVPADVPDKAKEGIFNLILSKANAETSLLARLCIAIYNLYGWLGPMRLARPVHAL